ncbi:MAG TPA: hypothetical protein VM243_07940 [Phycisphaerae bacterium]|nr:hypothetical protein [Phycisphaerae bacterium]
MTVTGRWLVPAGVPLLAVAVAAGVGYYPTLRLAGESARSALVAGSLIGLIANWLGLAAMRLFTTGDLAQGPTAVLAAMAVRFAAVLLLAPAAALTGWFQLGALLIWVAIGYLVALFVETLWLVQAQQHKTETDG